MKASVKASCQRPTSVCCWSAYASGIWLISDGYQTHSRHTPDAHTDTLPDALQPIHPDGPQTISWPCYRVLFSVGDTSVSRLRSAIVSHMPDVGNIASCQTANRHTHSAYYGPTSSTFSSVTGVIVLQPRLKGGNAMPVDKQRALLQVNL